MSSNKATFEVHRFATRRAAANAAAEGIAAIVGEAIEARGRGTIAFSGGQSPVPMLRALAGKDVLWQQVHVFQVDERDAPARSDARNWKTLHTNLLRSLGLRPEQLHPIAMEEGELCAVASSYASQLATLLGSPARFDLVVLGLGEDGHTASLVPGDPVLTASADVAVTSRYQGYRRVTLTYPALRRARRVLWFVVGDGKKEVLERLLLGDDEIPAARLRHGKNSVYTDCG